MSVLINIGPCPADEDCEQLGPNYRPARAKAECKAFMHQLRRQFGKPPEECVFRMTSERHDFGTYHEVAIQIPDGGREQWPEAWEYASKCEGDAATTWDDEARKELGL